MPMIVSLELFTVRIAARESAAAAGLDIWALVHRSAKPQLTVSVRGLVRGSAARG